MSFSLFCCFAEAKTCFVLERSQKCLFCYFVLQKNRILGFFCFIRCLISSFVRSLFDARDNQKTLSFRGTLGTSCATYSESYSAANLMKAIGDYGAYCTANVYENAVVSFVLEQPVLVWEIRVATCSYGFTRPVDDVVIVLHPDRHAASKDAKGAGLERFFHATAETFRPKSVCEVGVFSIADEVTRVKMATLARPVLVRSFQLLLVRPKPAGSVNIDMKAIQLCGVAVPECLLPVAEELSDYEAAKGEMDAIDIVPFSCSLEGKNATRHFGTYVESDEESY